MNTQFNTIEEQNKIFEKAFNELNPEQKKAVVNIEGPLLVIAGPGTGKTQILAMRIGYILKNTDTAPHNILCLTYTEAGTIAMRKRLVDFIGSMAYNVHIYTFHAFANQVIQDNMYLFGDIRELQPLSDLEKSEVYIELIDQISHDSSLKRFKGNRYFDKKKFEILFQDMKREGWDISFINQKIDEHLEEMKHHPDLLYKRRSTRDGKSYEKGDLKEVDYAKIVDKMEKLKAGAQLYISYEKLMKEKGRYDYDDMILWVLREFQENESLRLRYQEQYLYFLVDEYQDTNGVQNKLLETMADYWENPNVFAVGDDDQSIFRFQGANMENILDFQRKYNPKLVVLDKNYRSTQIILDASAGVIKNNRNRLSNSLSIDKNIIAKGNNAEINIPVTIFEFPNNSQEEAYIFDAIKNLVQKNEELQNNAIIYRNHKQVADLIKILESKGIPLNVRRKVNVLTDPYIKRIIYILKFIQSEYKESGLREDLLFKTMISPLFNISYADVMKIGRMTRKKDEKKNYRSWMEVISDKKLMKEWDIREVQKIHEIYRLFESWLLKSAEITIQSFFEKVITESGILDDALISPDRNWKMQLLNTFFNFIKDESVRNPGLNLERLLDSLDKMELSEVPLPVQKIISADKGIHFITGHSAKGLEFDRVFLMGVNAKQWERKSTNNNVFRYPENMFLNPSEDKEEDERRVFFVASTRAKKELLISYASSNDDGKELESSRFMQELKESGSKLLEESKKVSDELLLEYKAGSMEHVELPETELIDSNLVEEELEKFEMSVTALNKYLRCPVTFYYENILKVPFARNSYSGFGLAIHYSLEQFFNESKSFKKEGFGSSTLLTDLFEKGMKIYHSHFTDKEYENLMVYGKQTLNEYHIDQLEKWFKPLDFKLEEKISKVEFRGVPIKGVIDKMEIYKDYVNVIDYKTGKPENARKKLKAPLNDEDPGGDYWRQLVFYKILVENDKKYNRRVQSSELNFVEADSKKRFSNYTLNVQAKDIQIVGDQLVESYNNIMNQEFSQGCGDKDCLWCNFIKERKLEYDPLNADREYEEETS